MPVRQPRSALLVEMALFVLATPANAVERTHSEPLRLEPAWPPSA
jgi:hypothetical protein